jgi:hypothetical protein
MDCTAQNTSQQRQQVGRQHDCDVLISDFSALGDAVLGTGHIGLLDGVTFSSTWSVSSINTGWTNRRSSTP